MNQGVMAITVITLFCFEKGCGKMNKEELKTIDVFGEAETSVMRDARNADSAARYDAAAKTL